MSIRQKDVSPEVWAKLQAANGKAAKTAAKSDRTELVSPALLHGDGLLIFTIPLRLDPVTNGGAFKKRLVGVAGKHRRAVAAVFAHHLAPLAKMADAALEGRPMLCRITRLGGGAMDTDNLPVTAKWARDYVALVLGVGDGPNGPIRWEYAQEPGGRCGVRIELKILGPIGAT